MRLYPITCLSHQAYIHTRMRKRTADFLQGKYHAILMPAPAANPVQYSTEHDQRTRSERGRRPAGGPSGFRARHVHVSSASIYLYNTSTCRLFCCICRAWSILPAIITFLLQPVLNDSGGQLESSLHNSRIWPQILTREPI